MLSRHLSFLQLARARISLLPTSLTYGGSSRGSMPAQVHTICYECDRYDPHGIDRKQHWFRGSSFRGDSRVRRLACPCPEFSGADIASEGGVNVPVEPFRKDTVAVRRKHICHRVCAVGKLPRLHIGSASAILPLCVPHEIITHRPIHPLAEAWRHAGTSACDLMRRRSNPHDIDRKQHGFRG